MVSLGFDVLKCITSNNYASFQTATDRQLQLAPVWIASWNAAAAAAALGVAIAQSAAAAAAGGEWKGHLEQDAVAAARCAHYAADTILQVRCDV